MCLYRNRGRVYIILINRRREPLHRRKLEIIRASVMKGGKGNTWWCGGVVYDIHTAACESRLIHYSRVAEHHTGGLKR